MYRYQIKFSFKCSERLNAEFLDDTRYKFMIDGNMLFLEFVNVDNRDFVTEIIDRVADTICVKPYYELYDKEEEVFVDIESNTTTKNDIREYNYCVSFPGRDNKNEYKYINAALGCNMTHNLDTYKGPKYSIEVDDRIIELCFADVDDASFVRNIISKVATIFGLNPKDYFELYNQKTYEDITV